MKQGAKNPLTLKVGPWTAKIDTTEVNGLGKEDKRSTDVLKQLKGRHGAYGYVDGLRNLQTSTDTL